MYCIIELILNTGARSNTILNIRMCDVEIDEGYINFNKEDIPSTSGLATEKFVNDKVQGLASTDYVDQAIADIPQPDLSNYYTKTEVDNLIPSTTGFITIDDVKEQGYQTAAQVNTAISNALDAIGVAEGRTY